MKINAVEWFTVIEGEAILRLEDISVLFHNIYQTEVQNSSHMLPLDVLPGILRLPVRSLRASAYVHAEIPDQGKK